MPLMGFSVFTWIAVEFVQRIRDTFKRKMVEPQRLEAIGRYMALSKKLDENAVREYFTACGEEMG